MVQRVLERAADEHQFEAALKEYLKTAGKIAFLRLEDAEIRRAKARTFGDEETARRAEQELIDATDALEAVRVLQAYITKYQMLELLKKGDHNDQERN